MTQRHQDGVEVRTDLEPVHPFFTTRAPGEGSGLGLSVCYGIVAEPRGRRRVGDRQDRRGAIFTVELPAGAVS